MKRAGSTTGAAQLGMVILQCCLSPSSIDKHWFRCYVYDHFQVAHRAAAKTAAKVLITGGAMHMRRVLGIGGIVLVCVSSCWGMDAQAVIKHLRLVPMTDEACPGYYRVTYHSTVDAVVERKRQAASLIYYMMTTENREDPWHRINSDEIMLYHGGAPMHIVLLYPDGSWGELVLGGQFDQGHEAQVVIPAGTWMGFVLLDSEAYDWGLYGVLVVPSWHIDDIEFVQGDEVAPLRQKYPAAFEQIDKRAWPVLQGRKLIEP